MKLPLRVLVLEDDDGTRRSLCVLLRRRGADPVAVGTVADARNLIASERFDVFLFDERLGDGSGIALLEELRAQGQNQHAIVLSGLEATAIAELVNPCIDAKAVLARKPLEPERLESLLTAAYLHKVLPNAIADRVDRLSFSHQQKRVLAGVVRGDTVNEIAAELGVQPSTVRDHVAAIRARFNASSMRDLVRVVLFSEDPHTDQGNRPA